MLLAIWVSFNLFMIYLNAYNIKPSYIHNANIITVGVVPRVPTVVLVASHPMDYAAPPPPPPPPAPLPLPPPPRPLPGAKSLLTVHVAQPKAVSISMHINT